MALASVAFALALAIASALSSLFAIASDDAARAKAKRGEARDGKKKT